MQDEAAKQAVEEWIKQTGCPEVAADAVRKKFKRSALEIRENMAFVLSRGKK